MNGTYLKDTPIAVDIWQRPRDGKSYIYFLTHLHADHTKGLTSSWRFPFYTSPMNKDLLQRKFQFAKGIVIPLELDVPHVIPTNVGDDETMTVTLIDANHVPGSVMFLFQGSFGNILYTGDMRFYPEVFEHPILRHSLVSEGIDCLYLDNTFCHPSYTFPSREEALQKLFRIIEHHPNHVVKLGVRNLGKEDLLEAVAQKFQELIYVHEEKFEQLKILKRPNVYTTDPSESRIHALMLNRIHTRNHERWNQTEATISILLSAIYYGIPVHEIPLLNIEGVFAVPYSDHSSWEELKSFVQRVKPRKVLPIVKSSNKKDIVSLSLKGREDMSVFNKFLGLPLSKPVRWTNSKVMCCIYTQEVESRGLNDGKNIPKVKMRKSNSRGVRYTSFEEFENRIANNSRLQSDTQHPVNDLVHNVHAQTSKSSRALEFNDLIQFPINTVNPTLGVDNTSAFSTSVVNEKKNERNFCCNDSEMPHSVSLSAESINPFKSQIVSNPSKIPSAFCSLSGKKATDVTNNSSDEFRKQIVAKAKRKTDDILSALKTPPVMDPYLVLDETKTLVDDTRSLVQLLEAAKNCY